MCRQIEDLLLGTIHCQMEESPQNYHRAVAQSAAAETIPACALWKGLTYEIAVVSIKSAYHCFMNLPSGLSSLFIKVIFVT